MKKTGLFGGTFNPIHLGHLIIAQHFVNEMNLDSCIFIPSSVSPFKTENKDILNLEDRIKLVDLAIEDNPHFSVSHYEAEKGGVSYSHETVEYFSALFPEDKLYLLIGGDQSKSFYKWKNYKSILSKVNLTIADRPETLSSHNRDEINKKLSTSGKIIWLDSPLIEISSTDIRNKIKDNIPVRYLLPQKCEDYIIKNDLYK